MPEMNDLVAQTSGGQASRVAAQGNPDANADLVAQLVQNTQQQNQLAQAQKDVPNLGDHLKSPEGIAAILSMLAGVSTGDQQIGDAATGFAGGFMEQRQSESAQQSATIAKAQADTQKMLEANKQRLSTMITSRPELFVDPETGKSVVDPRLLGYASTGFMLPVDPGAAHALATQTANQKTMVQVGTKLMLEGDTPEKRRQGGVIMRTAMGLDLSDEFFDAIAGQDETKRWETLLGNDNIDTASGLRAWTFATQNGRNMADPEVIGMLLPGTGDTSGKYTIQDKTLDLVGEFTKIMGTADGTLQNAPLSDQVDFAFAGREGDIALMKKHFLGDDAFGSGINGNQMLNMLQSSGQMLTMMFMMAPDSSFLKNMGIEQPEDIWKVVGKLSDSAIAYAQDAQAAQTSQNVGLKINQLATSMRDQDPKLSFGASSNMAAVEVQKLREKHTTPSGQFDLRAFNADVTKLIVGE